MYNMKKINFHWKPITEIPTQLEYFRKEMNNLINRGIYDTRR